MGPNFIGRKIVDKIDFEKSAQIWPKCKGVNLNFFDDFGPYLRLFRKARKSIFRHEKAFLAGIRVSLDVKL